jgi:DNA-binding response OmpR family regulator
MIHPEPSLGSLPARGSRDAVATERESPAAEMPGPILIVDDSDELRDMIRGALEGQGYAVRTAADGRDALAQLARSPRPCLVVLDVLMPYKGGMEVIAAMRANAELADVPTILWSHLGPAEIDGVRVLPKPTEFESLLAIVREHADQAAPRH